MARLVDSDRGRAWIVAALPLYAPQSGLTVRAGRIEGGVFGRLRIHDLALGDPGGVFARVPVVDLDWRPLALVDNRLEVRSATAATAVLLRRPRLRPSADPRILPDIDIVVGSLRVGRLTLAAPVTGRAETAGFAGSADIRSGRARVDARAASSGGDIVHVHLDTEPDRDRFDLAATVAAPARGTLARLLGLTAPLDVTVEGTGRWTTWRGTAVARLGAVPLADLALTANAGRFVVTGTAAPAPLLGGALARLTAAGVAVRLDARLAGRRLNGTLAAASPALQTTARGSIDFATERFDGVVADAHLLQPAVFKPKLSGRDIRLSARIGGSFAHPLIDYAVTSPAFAWGRTGFTDVRATGRVDAGAVPLTIPVDARASRVDNVGDDLAPLLADLRIAGPLRIVRGQVASDTLAVRTARIAATMTLRVDLVDGGYAVGLDARLPGYRVRAIGVADIAARLRVFDRADGTHVAGTVRAVGTRLDTALFRSVFAGLPAVTSAVAVAPDLSMRFTDLALAAPGLRVAGSGVRLPDGTVRLATAGASRDYGPAAIDLAGPLDAPVVDVALAAPGAGLTAVAAHIAPGAAGWSIAARGGSPLGPATLAALVRADAAGIDVDAAVAGVNARGRLVVDGTANAAGRLAVSGAGLGGGIVLLPAGVAQRADFAVTARDARVGGAVIGTGNVTGRATFGDGPLAIDARAEVAGLRVGGATVTRANAQIATTAGRGTVMLTAAGVAGAPFTLAADATVDADRVDLGLTATVDGRKLGLDHRAVATRTGTTWRLTPVTLVTPDGRVALSGIAGDGVRLDARLDALGLSLLTLVDPDYNFGGRASGTVALTFPAAGAPSANASVRVAGLTRAGIAATSLPVDLAVNAALTPANATVRAVIVRGAATLGRIQADLALAPGGSFADRLLAAPLFAQARFDGPAQALWLLGGVEALDVRGPVVVAVDAAGRLGDPRLSGQITTSGARVEAVALGTVVDNLRLDGRFTGSRLDLTRFAGTVGKDGRISGSGGIDLSSERGFPVDVAARLDKAQVLDRDDLLATASGSLTLHSTGGGGRIGGKLDIVRGRFRLGRAAAADVATLTVVERNTAILGRSGVRTVRPTAWTLDIAATARDDFEVVGLGIDSRWRGDLRLSGRANDPELTGRVRLTRGDYDFAGKRFTVTRGDVRFTGGTPPDPVIDIAAENLSAGFTAQLSLTGTALHPDIKFGSTPALPEDEVLSRVLFGSSITTLSAPEAVQLAGALASLRGGRASVLDPFGVVRKTLRIDRLRVLPADATKGRKTAIAAGQYIGRRLYVELATDAQGYSSSAVEISLSRSLSILSDVATLGGTSVNLRLKKDY